VKSRAAELTAIGVPGVNGRTVTVTAVLVQASASGSVITLLHFAVVMAAMEMPWTAGSVMKHAVKTAF